MNVNTKIPTNGGWWLDKFGEAWKQQIETVKSKFGGAIEEIRDPWSYPTDVPILYVKKDSLLKVLEFLKTDPAFAYAYLADYTATDEEVSPRFELVFNLYAMDRGHRIRVKCRLEEGEEAPTCISLWPGADWAEREIFDMFGVRFTDHPNLRRILMDYRWVGYPLRKDYPIDGFQLFPDAEAPDPERLK
jgi:NADH-quinone oxidoreductase subunit C